MSDVDEIVKNIQEMFPTMDKTSIRSVLESQQYKIEPTINALLVISDTTSSSSTSSQKIPILQLPSNLPSISGVGLGKLGFGIRDQDIKGEIKEISEKIQQLTVIASSAVYHIDWSDFDINTYNIAVKHAVQVGLTLVANLSITSETDNGILSIKAPKSIQVVGKPSFGNKQIAESYIETVKKLASSKPPYICIANDVNYLAISRHDEYQRFLPIYKQAYVEAKRISPTTKIFASFQYEILKQVKTENAKIIHELKPEIDALGVISHPYDLLESIDLLEDNHYEELKKYCSKDFPALVIEIGWPSKTVETDAFQLQFVQRLPKLFEGISPIVTCWDFLKDSPNANTSKKFVYDGLLTEDGSRKKSFFEWEKLHMKSPHADFKPQHRRNLSDQTRAPLPPPIAVDRLDRATTRPYSEFPKIEDKKETFPPLQTNSSVEDPDKTITIIPDDIFTVANKIDEKEIRGFSIVKALSLCKSHPKDHYMTETGWRDLLYSRIAYLLSLKVLEISKGSALMGINKLPSTFYDADKIEDIVHDSFEKVLEQVLADKEWLEKKKIHYQKYVQFKYDIFEDQGPRPYMEDSLRVLPFLNELYGFEDYRISYFGVFDGHGGSQTAEYVSTYLHCNFMEHLLKSGLENIRTVLNDAFVETDENYVKYSERKSINPRMGSTGVVSILINEHIYTAWAGDSESYLVNKGHETYKFVSCHKPKEDSERIRIEKRGGIVNEVGGLMRVNGMLAVSRAFGDIHLKPVLGADPEIAVYHLKGQEKFLTVGCDGIWDVINQFDLDDLLNAYANQNKTTIGISGYIGKEARKRGSQDNITSVVVSFV